jgi:hypothetical protein
MPALRSPEQCFSSWSTLEILTRQRSSPQVGPLDPHRRRRMRMRRYRTPRPRRLSPVLWQSLHRLRWFRRMTQCYAVAWVRLLLVDGRSLGRQPLVMPRWVQALSSAGSTGAGSSSRGRRHSLTPLLVSLRCSLRFPRSLFVWTALSDYIFSRDMCTKC